VSVPRRLRSLVIVVAALGVMYGVLPAAGASAAMSSSLGASSKKPNVVFILTDDLDLTSYLDPSLFPKVDSLLVEKGATFSNYFVTDSLCCPSRSSTLRGQYVHEHGVLGNLVPDGGYQKFHANGDEKSTVATWLHHAGYRTGLLGKYLNGYPQSVDPAFRARRLGRVG